MCQNTLVFVSERTEPVSDCCASNVNTAISRHFQVNGLLKLCMSQLISN